MRIIRLFRKNTFFLSNPLLQFPDGWTVADCSEIVENGMAKSNIKMDDVLPYPRMLEGKNMDAAAIPWEEALGKRLNRDVFTSGGVLLISVSTVLSQEHIQVLRKHGIVLAESDVSTIGPYTLSEEFPYTPSIENAVKHVYTTFEEVRQTKKLNMNELRQQVIPLLHEVAGTDQLLGLFAALQARDDYTFRHNVAVGAIVHMLGEWIGIPQKELMQLTTAALLHDVGKMLIPKEILNKPERLTDEEFVWMKNHTVHGYELLKETVGINHRQALVALQHHERMDGSGYPFGLMRDQIDLFSRIVAVADVFHAMTSKRVYRDPSPFYEILYQMEQDAFGVLDPQVTRLFIEKIMQSLIGHSVVLTDGSEGILVLIHPHDPTRPMIQIGERFIDLSREVTLRIQQIK